ncbi:glyoxylate carboligase [Candidatus Vecturithrix granuli]|uniref:Glyoxylate carboligase n=1 Tax=Vecturithrix granuli TaxID=1499967 RepID=A0A0S6WAA6_VECG1|nr:glyoxylate carboligase [Candidatus Vecturithrix granuli]
MNVSEAIVKMLESVGVERMFGGSGHSVVGMLLTIKKASKHLKAIMVKNEQAASFMACGYAMFSDKLGVCFSSGGPGEFNLLSGLAVALSDSLPVLAISGHVSEAEKGKGALNESSGLRRTPDARAIFAATTKKSFIVEHPDQICDIMEEAVNLAFEGRPGPVHIHLPKSVVMADVKNFREIKLNIKPVLPDPATIREFAQVLEKALTAKEQIVALIGYGAVRSHAEQELLAFVEQFQIPFITTMDAKGILSEDHPLSLGGLGRSGDPGAKKYFDQSKIVLAIGNSFAQNATYAFQEDLYQNKVLMHINIDAEEISKVYHADYRMVSDVKPAIAGLTAELSRTIRSVEPKTIVKEKWYDLPIEYSGSKIYPADMVKVLSRNLPENAIVLGDAGANMLWLYCYLKMTKRQNYQNPGSFGPMASHVNGAIGIKCANPDRPVISGCGDGDYLMAGFELLTAVENNIPVIWIVFNNGDLSVNKYFMIQTFGEHAYMQFKNPDYAAYAKACGAVGYTVTKLEDFEPVLQEALRLNQPVLIDVVIESEVYPPFHLGRA